MNTKPQVELPACPWHLLLGSAFLALVYGALSGWLLLIMQGYPRLSFLVQLALAAIPLLAWRQAHKRGWPPTAIPTTRLQRPFSRATRRLLWFVGVSALICLFLAWRELKTDRAVANLIRLQAAQIPYWAASALRQHQLTGLAWLVAAVLCQAVLISWFEELFFRGFLFAALQARVRTLLAWFLSGLSYCGYQAALWNLAFDLWDPREFKRYVFGYLVFHALCCRLLTRGRSLAPAIAFHVLWSLGLLLAQVAGLFL